MITNLTAAELARKMASRELSCREVTKAYLDKIASEDEKVGCFLTIDAERAIADADHSQSMIDRGEAKPLSGVPVAIKDNISTAGIETTCASKILKGYVPPYDATVIQKMHLQGMVVLGKTNLDEFAMGTSTENSAFQVTRNPWDLKRSPGGSSGGSASAVAASFTPLALGSDTGGSIRQPASLCGIVGFKPTYGRCSRYGLVAFGSSLDQIGPLARTVEDAALLSEVITGWDPMDSTSLNMPQVDPKELKKGSIKGLRAAIPKEMFGEAVDPGVRAEIEKSIKAIESAGVEVTQVSIPSIAFGVTTYYIIAPAEASSNLARFDGIRFGPRAEGKGHIGQVERTRAQGFGHEVKARIMIGTYALSAGYYDAFYLRAQQVRALMTQEFQQAFQDFDFIISPTSPVTAFELGALTNDPMALKMLDYCTIPANMNGMPAISLNCGFADGLPVGLQLLAAPLQDEKLLQIAHCVEQLLPDATRQPPAP